MKTAILILSILSIKNQCNAQEIELTQLEIKKGTSQSLFLNYSQEQMTTWFGGSDSSEDFFYEMDNLMARRHLYGINEFYFVGDEFDAFDLKNSLFKVGYNNNFISVGDHISSIANIYPNYQELLKENYIHLPCQYEGDIWDTVIIIEFNATTKIITRILRYDP